MMKFTGSMIADLLQVAGKVGVRIEQVGDRIALRAKLPPKP
jgi:hypothetical protein